MSLAPVEKRRGAMVTDRQVEILKALVRRNTDWSALDIYQLMDATGHVATRAAMISSLKHLISHAMVTDAGKQTRRSRSMQTFVTTDLGRGIVRPANLP